jgi:hypothetical protein
MIGTRAGRILSAVGATALIAGLFLTWYHIDRAVGPTDTTGWQTFTRLRWLILLGAVVLLATAVVRQTRAVLLARFFLGLVLGALILRRIIDPPNIANISSQFGVFVGVLGAACAVLGGLVDTSREVIDRYPDLAFWREPVAELGPGGGGAVSVSRRPPERGRPDTVDSTAEEL